MRLPMFPLNSVVFPNTAVPLRVFETRYQRLLDRVMRADGQFGIVLIERGHEVGGDDVRFDVGSRVKVVAMSPITSTEDQAIVVVGMNRIRVKEWLPDDPHPEADVVELPEQACDSTQELDDALISLRKVLALASEIGANVAALNLDLADDPVAASFQLSSLCPLAAIDQQKLLEAPDSRSRLVAAKQMLDEQAELLRYRLSLS
ncbi:MAG TPA: LON peptidase substrate-binding domain-containing protein [Acidimicrobiia bacterium]|nr:LON peptidase substrate-binding domain-containing protein [Acidimicrobiia bacterium]